MKEIIVHPPSFEWFDCTASFKCRCGSGMDIIVDSQSDPTVCVCGRRYKLIAYVVEMARS